MNVNTVNIKTGFLLLLSILFLIACGSGGGGGGGNTAPPPDITPAAVNGFAKTVVLPSVPSGITAGDWDSLFSGLSSSTRHQALVRTQDIQGSGPLRSLAFRFGAASTGNSCPNVTIKLVHRAVGVALDTTFANNVTPGRGAPVTVFGPATLTIPAGASGDYFTIPLSGAFNYNGVEDLIVDIESDACTANTVLDAHDADPVYTALIRNIVSRAEITGSEWNSLADMKFGFVGGDDRVQSPGAVGINAAPFLSTSGVKIQLLYYPAEIDGGGPITGIAFPIAGGEGVPPGPVTAQTHTVTVRLGHSTRTVLTDTFANNFNRGAPVTAANAISFEIPAGVPAGRYLWVPLPDGTFNYNGRDNLVVEIETTPSAALTWVTTHEDGVSLRRLFALSGEATGSLDSVVNDIQLRFAGGTMDVHTPEAMFNSTTDSFPFWGTDNKRQYLYRAAELGTKGEISKIACRAGSGSGGGAETGFNYTIVLSRTSASTLGNNFADNLTSPVTVLNGSFDLPAVAAGDWIEIPLTTAFAYNGVDNLVVEFSGSGGTASSGFACALDGAAHYAARRLIGFPASATATDGIVTDGLPDMRFIFQ